MPHTFPPLLSFGAHVSDGYRKKSDSVLPGVHITMKTVFTAYDFIMFPARRQMVKNAEKQHVKEKTAPAAYCGKSR